MENAGLLKRIWDLYCHILVDAGVGAGGAGGGRGGVWVVPGASWWCQQ